MNEPIRLSEPYVPVGSVVDVVNTLVLGASAVSWGAILAGAAGAAALSLILLILGTGLGLSSVSPWANHGVSATTFGISTIVWITFTQLVAFGTGTDSFTHGSSEQRVRWFKRGLDSGRPKDCDTFSTRSL